MAKADRLSGIDLFKGIASFAVIILHIGDTTNSLSIDLLASQFRNFCSFVVPFFLIVSFYLLARRFYITEQIGGLQVRCQRLLIPYISWSIFYLLARSVKFLLSNDTSEFNKVSDLVSIIFFGAAAVPLYFIPLLLTGTILFYGIANSFFRGANLTLLGTLLLAVIVLDNFVFFSGNYFLLGPNVAFASLAQFLSSNLLNNLITRVFLVALAWSIYCLPLIFSAVIIAKLKYQTKLQIPKLKLLSICSALFFGISTFNFYGFLDFSPPILGLFRVTLLLIISLLVSSYIPSSEIIQDLGKCSFGIYLIHYFVIQILRSFISKTEPTWINHISVPTQLILASITFLTSWFITSLLMKNKNASRVLLGV